MKIDPFTLPHRLRMKKYWKQEEEEDERERLQTEQAERERLEAFRAGVEENSFKYSLPAKKVDPKGRRNDPIGEFLRIVETSSEPDAKRWLVHNLDRFPVEFRKDVLFAFYEDAKTPASQKNDELTFSEFVELVKKHRDLLR